MSWPDDPGRSEPPHSVVVYLGTGDHDLPRCMRYVEDHGLVVAALTSDWPTARGMHRRGAAEAILVPPGDEHRRHEGVIVAAPDGLPRPSGPIDEDDVRYIRKLIALGEDTGTIVRRVTQRRRTAH